MKVFLLLFGVFLLLAVAMSAMPGKVSPTKVITYCILGLIGLGVLIQISAAAFVVSIALLPGLLVFVMLYSIIAHFFKK